MKKQLENRILTSFALMVDHKISTKGEAFENVSGDLYPANKNLYQGFHTYSAPYEQWVGDTSVTGAKVATGVFLNNLPVGIGTSGLAAINYEQGQVHFSSSLPASTSVTASYAIKGVNVYLTEESEEKLLFFTKYSTRPKTSQSLTGLATDAITVPAIFLKIDGGRNEPFCLGGTDRKVTDIRGIIIAKSSYELDAIGEILKNISRLYCPLIDEGIQFGALGYTGIAYSYTGLATGTDSPFIRVANFIKTPTNSTKSDFKDLSPDLRKGIVDFELETFLDPRA